MVERERPLAPIREYESSNARSAPKPIPRDSTTSRHDRYDDSAPDDLDSGYGSSLQSSKYGSPLARYDSRDSFQRRDSFSSSANPRHQASIAGVVRGEDQDTGIDGMYGWQKDSKDSRSRSFDHSYPDKSKHNRR